MDAVEAMQIQIACNGCRGILVFPRGPTNVCCPFCNTIISVPPPASSHSAHIHCGNCRTTLMYPYGAPSVKCAVCQHITDTNRTNGRVPSAVHRPNGTTNSGAVPSTSTSMPHSQGQTVSG